LIVEDSEDDALLVVHELKNGGYHPAAERVETAEAMRWSLLKKPWDVILCDYSMPKFNAMAAISLLKEVGVDIPVIIVFGAIGGETAADCILHGARDCIMRDDLSRLVPAIERELMKAASRRKRKEAEETLLKTNSIDN